MKCVKCNQEIPVGSPFCGVCGTKVSSTKMCGRCGALVDTIALKCDVCGSAFENPNQVTQVVQPQIQPTFVNVTPTVPVQPINQPDKKSNSNKLKLPIIIVCCVIVLSIIIFIIFKNMKDESTLAWVESYGDYNINHTSGGTLELKIDAIDGNNKAIKDITYETDGGSVKKNTGSISWTLPDKPGTYTLTVSIPSGKKITKKVTVLEPIVVRLDKGMIIPEVATNENTDTDSDGLTDTKEKEIGTNHIKADTDQDGIIDIVEIEQLKTDSLKKDTDGDTLSDGAEVELGLSPLEVDSKKDGINDAQRELTYKVVKDDVTLVITGKGHINETTINISEVSTFEAMNGVYPVVYDFDTNGEISNVEVTINYSEEELKNYDISERTVSLYSFDINTKKLEKITTESDLQKNRLTAKVTKPTKLVIVDSDKLKTEFKTEILFVIDNSTSMYSEAQLVDLGYEDTSSGIGNDTEFKRLTLTNNLIDTLNGNYEFGVSEFSGNYVNLQGFSADKEEVKKSVNKMKNKWHSETTGTDIIEAIQSGLMEYETNHDDHSHYLILLTDGKNTEGYLSNYQSSIINEAKEKNVNICVIGLGDSLDDEELDNIAEGTGCDYYPASTSTVLDEIYALVGAEINYNLVDTDNDGNVDSTILADSGFITTRDGFSFNNYATTDSEDGHCYGMSTFAMLYYTNQLPSSLNSVDEYGLFFEGTAWYQKKANGYNLKNTYFFNSNGDKKANNLYDYKFATAGVNAYINPPKDYRTNTSSGLWQINDKYKEWFNSIGVTITEKEYDGNGFDSYESALLNINSETFKNGTTADDQNLLKAIYHLYMLQVDDERYSFMTEPDAAYNYLVKQLESGVPVVLTVDGKHAVNAIRILRNNEDSDKFKIEIYDSSYAGQPLYIEGTRYSLNKDLGIETYTNEYDYEFTYQGKRISLDVNRLEI